MALTVKSPPSYRWQRSQAPQPEATFPVRPEELARILFPADIVGTAGPNPVLQHLDLVIVAPGGSELLRLPIEVERRLQTADIADIWGFDTSKTLQTYIRAERNGAWSVALTPAGDSITASHAEFVLRVVQIMTPPNSLALTPPGGRPDNLTRIEQPAVNEPPPPGMTEYVNALVRLEAHVKEPIIVPDSETNFDRLRELEVASALIAGETVLGQWEPVTITIPAVQARELVRVASQSAPVLEETRPWIVHVGELSVHRVEPVVVTYRAVRVAESPVDLQDLPNDTLVPIRIEPADEERAIELARVVALNDDPVTRVTPAQFEDLVSSLEAPDEQLPELARAAARLHESHE